MGRLLALLLYLLPRVAAADAPPGTYTFTARTEVTGVVRDGEKVPRCADKDEHAIVRGELTVDLHADKVFVNGQMWRHLAMTDHVAAHQGSAKDGLWIDVAFWRDKADAHGHVYVWHIGKGTKVRCVDARTLRGTYRR